MKVTDVRIKEIDMGKLKAVASVTFDEVFVVHDIKIIDGEKGLFVAMPSHKTEGMYRDVAHPLNSDFRAYVVEEIMNAYNS